MNVFQKNQTLRLLLFDVLVLTLVFILLYPKFPLLGIPGTYVAIRLEDLLISFLIGFWFFTNLSKIRHFLKLTITQAMLLFWFIGVLTIISGFFITHSLQPHLGVLHWLRRIEMMMLFFVVATTIDSQNKVKTLLKVLFVVNLAVVLYGFGQVYLDLPVISTTNKEFSKGLILKLTPDARANSTFAGHYDLAVYLSIMLIFIGNLFFHYKTKIVKALLALSGFFSFALLGLTAARLSFAATLLSLAVTFWFLGKRLLIIILILVSLLAVGLIPELRHRLVATITVNLIGGGGAKYSPPPDRVNIFTPESQLDEASVEAIIRESTKSGRESSISADIAAGEPINTTELGVYRSFNIRLNVEWPRAVRAFVKNPVLGTGYSSLNIATDNDILRSLGETGILGTLALVFIFFCLVRQLVLGLKKTTGLENVVIFSVLCSSFAIFLTSLLFDILEASKIAALFWIMLGTGWTIARGYKDAK